MVRSSVERGAVLLAAATVLTVVTSAFADLIPVGGPVAKVAVAGALNCVLIAVEALGVFALTAATRHSSPGASTAARYAIVGYGVLAVAHAAFWVWQFSHYNASEYVRTQSALMASTTALVHFIARLALLVAALRFLAPFGRLLRTATQVALFCLVAWFFFYLTFMLAYELGRLQPEVDTELYLWPRRAHLLLAQVSNLADIFFCGVLFLCARTLEAPDPNPNDS